MNLYIYVFDICAIYILLLTCVMMLVRKWVTTFQNIAFIQLALVVFGTVITELISTLNEIGYFNAHPSRQSLMMWTSLYYVFTLATALSFYRFILSFLDFSFYRIKLHGVDYIPFLVLIAFIGVNYFHPIFFDYDISGTYHRGKFLIVDYVIVIFYAVYALSLLIKYKKSLKVKNRMILRSVVVIVSLGVIIQGVFPRMLVQSFGMTISLILSYLTIQSPDEMVNEETGLLNYKAFKSMCRHDINSQRKFTVINVCAFQLDNSKLSLGYDQANRIVCLMADYLKKYSSKAQIFIIDKRNFAVMIRKPDIREIEEIVSDIRGRFSKPWSINGMDIVVKYYICGISYPEHFTDMEELYENMENAERIGSTVMVDIIDAGNTSFRKHLETRKNFHFAYDACSKGRLDIRYQPLKCCDTDDFIWKGKRVYFDAVAFFKNDRERWVNSKDYQINGYKDSRIMVIDEDIIDKTLVFLISLDAQLNNRVKAVFLIELSDNEFMRNDFCERMQALFRYYGVMYDRIIFKISETVSSKASEYHIKKISDMTQMGFRFIITNFGNGFSDLNRLSGLDAVCVSLDRKLVRKASESQKAAEMLSDMIDILHKADFYVIADGVDTLWQNQMVKNIHGDFSTGRVIGEFLAKYEVVSLFGRYE